MIPGLGDGGDLGLAADQVVVLPVLMLTEGATVARHVAARARLTGFPPAVPAALHTQRKQRVNTSLRKCRLSSLSHYGLILV